MKELSEKIYGYLEFQKIYPSAENDELIEKCLEELCSLDSFKCIYVKFSDPVGFLQKEPYISFLSGSIGYYLCAMTLGQDVDERNENYYKTNNKKAKIFDACANAYLEFKAEEYEKSLEKDISYKFSPGYQGSDIKDLKAIFDILDLGKIGMYLTEEFRIVPQKSMVGIIAIGKTAKKQCGKCIMLNSCIFRKAGKRCFDL